MQHVQGVRQHRPVNILFSLKILWNCAALLHIYIRVTRGLLHCYIWVFYRYAALVYPNILELCCFVISRYIGLLYPSNWRWISEHIGDMQPGMSGYTY
jgi:hypothetical protein